MHDKTLTRTTDIEEVMPSAVNEQAAMFTWDSLEELNAGTWFFKVLTFGTWESQVFSGLPNVL